MKGHSHLSQNIESPLQRDIDELSRSDRYANTDLTTEEKGVLQAIDIIKRIRREHLGNPQVYRFVFDAYKHLKHTLEESK